MKKVRFLQDFQGVETKGAFYQRDEEVDLEDFVADRVVKDGRAVLVNIPHANPVNEPQFEEAEPEPVKQPAFKRGKKYETNQG